MSNIHGFSNRNNNERTRLNANRAGMSLFYANPNDQTQNQNKDPRSETFFYALKINFCSTLKCKSFVFAFLIIMLVMFILQRLIDGINLPGTLLMVKLDGGFTKSMGMKYIEFNNGQVWRLITALLGFIDMQQWVSLTIFTLFFVTMVESVQGLKRCLGNQTNLLYQFFK